MVSTDCKILGSVLGGVAATIYPEILEWSASTLFKLFKLLASLTYTLQTPCRSTGARTV